MTRRGFLEECEQRSEGQVEMMRRYLNQINGKRYEEKRVRENIAQFSKSQWSGMTAVMWTGKMAACKWVHWVTVLEIL